MTFVSRKASAPVIDRSTWLSAAKWITAVGLWRAKIASIFARSQISACRNAYRLSFAMGSSDRRFAAYVSLSQLTTDTFRVAASCRHTAEPMNPAPPVTNTFIEDFLFEMVGETTEGWQGPVLFRQHGSTGLNWPMDT